MQIWCILHYLMLVVVVTEQAILREYDAGERLDEQSLTAAIEDHASTYIICPVCQK